MVGTVLVSDGRAVVALVLCQGDGVHLCVHLGAGDAAPASAGSADELWMEVCAAHDAVESVCRRAVAVHGRGMAALGCVFGDFGCGVRDRGPDSNAPQEFWAEDLSLCRIAMRCFREGAADERGLLDSLDHYSSRRAGGGDAEEYGALRARADCGVCGAGAPVPAA